MKNKLTQGETSEKNVWLYSFGNFANNIMFMMVAMYVMYFYTNILGVSAAVAGTIFMVARLIDAVTDPLMGTIVDRTNTKKFGKYRPFIIFGAPLLGIAFVMLFITPNLGPTGKIIYAYVSYIFYSLTWTIVQIPQLALPIILSKNITRRTRVQAIFQTLGAVGVMIIQSWALPMLNFFGGMDNAAAWSKVAIIYSVVATILFILSSLSVRNLDVYEYHEKKSKNKKDKPKVTLGQAFQAVLKNKALLCVLLAYSTDMFAYQISSALRVYFFKYNLNGRTDLMVYLGYVSLVAAIISIFVIASYVKKMGKRLGIGIVEALSLITMLIVLYATPRQNISLVMFGMIANLFMFSFTNMLARAAVLDSANYAELKTGVDNNALVSSTFTFMNKVCQAISVFFAGTILSYTGYNPDLVQQADGTLNGILYLMTLVPIVAYICSLIAMYFYPLTRQDEIEMEERLVKMHSQNQGTQIEIGEGLVQT
ncbi:MAG: MFS transporter [Firmicutes bacterium]|nr:MFS transporter [Bacillota bacterium]